MEAWILESGNKINFTRELIQALSIFSFVKNDRLVINIKKYIVQQEKYNEL